MLFYRKICLHSFVFIALIGLFISCKKKSISTTETIPNGTLVFHFHTLCDTNEIESYDSIYQTSDGRKISFELAQMYISQVKAIKLDGSLVDIANVKILKTLEEQYIVGELPVGNYKSVRFLVGFDVADNIILPTQDALLNHSEMWMDNPFSALSGYSFLHLKGKVDTSSSLNSADSSLTKFDIKLCSPNSQIINMPEQNFSVAANQQQFIHMGIDFYHLFDGIILTNSSSLNIVTAANNNSSVALKMSSNIPKMFSYE